MILLEVINIHHRKIITMTQLQVKQIIQELARANFNTYPECYPIVDGSFTYRGIGAIQDVAIGYWNNRVWPEIERDERLDIHLSDYLEWVMEEYYDRLRIIT